VSPTGRFTDKTYETGVSDFDRVTNNRTSGLDVSQETFAERFVSRREARGTWRLETMILSPGTFSYDPSLVDSCDSGVIRRSDTVRAVQPPDRPERIPQLTDAPAAGAAERPAVRCAAGGDQLLARGIEVVDVEVHDRAALRVALIGEVEEQLELAELDHLRILVRGRVERIAPEPRGRRRIRNESHDRPDSTSLHRVIVAL
jgi:hypothetical protein